MDDDTVRHKVAEYTNIDLSDKDELDALMIFILELDAYNFSKVLDKHISQKGLDETMLSVVYPLLDKIGVAWIAGSFLEVHESFVLQIIKSKIYKSIESLDEKLNFSPSYIIYLPKGEKQEISLLYFQYLLKEIGCKVVNLGAEIELGDVLFAIETKKPDYVFTILNQELSNMPLQQYINKIAESLGEGRLLVTGFQTLAPSITWPSNVTILTDLEETKHFIAGHASTKVN